MKTLPARWLNLRRHLEIRLGLLILLLILLSLAIYYGIGSGAVEIDAATIRQVILDRVSDRLGLGYQSELDYQDRMTALHAALILDTRLPRVVIGGLAGAALAMAGTALQGVFRNPLADPGLIGISSGGAVGAVTGILLHISLGSAESGERLAQSLAAFGCAILTTLLVYRLAYRHRRTDSVTLLLVGLAVNAIAAAYVGMATFLADQGEAGDIVFWTLGSLVGIFWRDVHIMLPVTLGGLMVFPVLARQLNLIALGEAEARHLGVAVERLRVIVMLLSALMIGVAVALVGIIGFVGLVVPHTLRLLFGPDHRWLLPLSALGGGALVIGADVFARTVAVPSEVPLGVVTTLIGGPFFLFLILIYRGGLES
jgi:iron complex transport system permease protein